MSRCDSVQRRLAEAGIEAAEAEDIARHLAGCADCSAIFENLRAVDAALGALPPHDAADVLVARTLDAVRAAGQPKPAPARPSRRQRRLAGGLAASVVIAASLVLTLNLIDPALRQIVLAPEAPVGRESLASAQQATGESEAGANSATGAPAPRRDSQTRGPASGDFRTGEAGSRGVAAGRLLDEMAQAKPAKPEAFADTGSPRLNELEVIALVAPRALERRAGGVDDSDGLSLPGETGRDFAKDLENLAEEDAEFERSETAEQKEDDANRRGDRLRMLPGADAPANEPRAGEPPASGVAGSPTPSDPEELNKETPTNTAEAEIDAARRFLRKHRSLDGLRFQEPAGYWANTYIPGDPEIRLLRARLAAWDRSALGRYDRLEEDVRPVSQPFDAPDNAALAVTLNADVAAIAEPTRLRLQVGLQGAVRLGGRRPAMNIAVVVDLRFPVDAETGARIRALLTALERARQPGDRFSLTVAGPAGGLLVPPEQFRHGPLRVMIGSLFAPAPAGARVGLPEAVRLATENVRAGDDPNAVLGSSLVMLVTGASLAGDVDALERMAHANAVRGVPLSVVSLAGRDDLAHIDRLVAAGQGNRRVLDGAQAADRVVDRELHAASRVVARAVRLRIGLAPGVELVRVPGSRRLGEPQAARVREAEQSIDQRLARNLGVAADRGDDEDGIQMVIPNFYAGDSHAILIDVVAKRPGPIADVTVRYKDVVNLDNGVAQASLALGDTPREAGPLERSVLKNLVAFEFARQTRLAGRDLAAGNHPGADARLRLLKDLIGGLRHVVPGWRDDPDLNADLQVLNAYLRAVSLPPVRDPEQRRLLADSLRVAAFRKLQPVAAP